MQLLLFCQGCQQGTKKQWCSWNPLIWKPRWDLNHMQHVLWDDESTLLLLENFLLYITELLCCCFQQDGGQPWSRQQQKQRQRGLESKTCPPPPLCRKCHVSCTKSSKEIWNHPFSVGCWRCSGSIRNIGRGGWSSESRILLLLPWRVTNLLPFHLRGWAESKG